MHETAEPDPEVLQTSAGVRTAERDSENGTLVTRTTLAVFKGDKDVTAELPGITNVTEDGIRDCDAEDLYKVMQSIASLPAVTDAEVSEEFTRLIVAARKM